MPWLVQYDPATATLHSRVSGVLPSADVTAWRDALYRTAAAIPRRAAFRVLADIRGYEVAEQERAVHAVMREVLPVFLAEHGFVVGFWRLYEAVPPAAIPGARCRAVAHVHHDRDKMDRYNELLGSDAERFFDDGTAAREWLDAV